MSRSIAAACRAGTSSRPRARGARRAHWWDRVGGTGIATNGMSRSSDGSVCRLFRIATTERLVSRRRFARSDLAPCTSSCTPRRPFRFSTARRCPKRSSSAPRRSAIRRSRCSIATASTARRASISPRSKAGLKAIVGAELTMRSAVGGRTRRSRSAACAAARRLPVLSRIAQGYRNLCRLVTRMKLRGAEGGGRADARGARRPPAGSSRWSGAPRSAADGSASAACVDRIVGVFGAAQRVHRAAAPPAARRGSRQPRAARSRRGVSRAGHRDQRRALRRRRRRGRSTTSSPASATRRRWSTRDGG